MRITIEPTTDQSQQNSAAAVQHKVVVEHPDDDLTLDVIMALVEMALAGYGYQTD